MTEISTRPLIFLKDFTGQGRDRFFWLVDAELVEVSAAEIVVYSGRIICHDFWSMRDTIFDQTGALPSRFADLDELGIAISGDSDERKRRETTDITLRLSESGLPDELCIRYKRIMHGSEEFDADILLSVAQAMQRTYETLMATAHANGEQERIINIELPASRVINLAMARGINIDTKSLSEMRSEADHDFFLSLKDYSAKHGMALEVPSDKQLQKKLDELGFDQTGVSIEYILQYLPSVSDFGLDTIRLREANIARRILTSLRLSTECVRPIADLNGTRTSRIYLRDPSLQNIAKKYRRVIAAREGFRLCYVDYDQFEVGVMAVLSGDPELRRLYVAGDMYVIFANEYLGLPNNRRAAKQLFLSYAYGMTRKSLIDAAVSLGAERHRAKSAFKRFHIYETWKKTVIDEFSSSGVVGTVMGNFYRRHSSGQLSAKESRSAISQVIQGTASLIFKKAILALEEISDAHLVLPMHDAILFEYRSQDTPQAVVDMFQRVMTEHFGGALAGKASVGSFFSD